MELKVIVTLDERARDLKEETGKGKGTRERPPEEFRALRGILRERPRTTRSETAPRSPGQRS